MSFDWTAAEDAIRQWVLDASELSEEQVLWSHYSQPRPTGEFVSISIDGPTQVGLDYVQSSTDLSQPADQEIELKVIGTRDITVSVSCFGGQASSSTSSQAMASKIMTGVRLPSINSALHIAGVYPHGTPTIINVPGIIGAKFEPRAIVEHAFYIVEDISERTGYIATISGVGTISGTVGAVQPTPFIITID